MVGGACGGRGSEFKLGVASETLSSSLRVPSTMATFSPSSFTLSSFALTSMGLEGGGREGARRDGRLLPIVPPPIAEGAGSLTSLPFPPPSGTNVGKLVSDLRRDFASRSLLSSDSLEVGPSVTMLVRFLVRARVWAWPTWEGGGAGAGPLGFLRKVVESLTFSSPTATTPASLLVGGAMWWPCPSSVGVGKSGSSIPMEPLSGLLETVGGGTLSTTTSGSGYEEVGVGLDEGPGGVGGGRVRGLNSEPLDLCGESVAALTTPTSLVKVGAATTSLPVSSSSS